MDPLVFHTREIGSAHPRNRIHETVAHPKKDPIGSIGVLIFFVQEEKTFGLGMKDLAPLSLFHAGRVQCVGGTPLAGETQFEIPLTQAERFSSLAPDVRSDVPFW